MPGAARFLLHQTAGRMYVPTTTGRRRYIGIPEYQEFFQTREEAEARAGQILEVVSGCTVTIEEVRSCH